MPKLNIERTRELLQRFDFARLFIEELGWDRYSGALTVAIDGRTYSLRAFAEKRGVQIFECTADSGGKIPDYATRRKIEKQVSKSAYEHLIIYTDASKTSQVWQWVLRQPGQPAAYREHPFDAVHHSGDALIQKLGSITFSLSAEEGLTLTGVVFALRDAFDRDRLTKRFYKDFEREHAA
ncbi:MAG: Eco57I restriction-modification methylase domain-containing protein, partial [Gammaproteobacteria bacterium]